MTVLFSAASLGCISVRDCKTPRVVPQSLLAGPLPLARGGSLTGGAVTMRPRPQSSSPVRRSSAAGCRYFASLLCLCVRRALVRLRAFDNGAVRLTFAHECFASVKGLTGASATCIVCLE